MGCKNCGKSILYMKTGKRSPTKYSGKKAYFVAKPEYKEISVAANGTTYTFYSDRSIEAPIEFQKFVFLQLAPKVETPSVAPKATDVMSTEVTKTDSTKKKDK